MIRNGTVPASGLRHVSNGLLLATTLQHNDVCKAAVNFEPRHAKTSSQLGFTGLYHAKQRT